MARAATKRTPRSVPPTKATPPGRRTSDADREARALDNAARRVPVWQVSVASGLMACRDADSTPDELKVRIGLALAQCPPAVVRAAQMHRAGRWRPL